MERKPRIFISYSHADEAWKNRLVQHLRVGADGVFDVWDDQRLGAGDLWHDTIVQAIESAAAVLLLVSADFLSSPFLVMEEVPRILSRAERSELLVIPIIVRPCAWQRVPWLATRQARPAGGRALSGLSDHDCEAELAVITDEIARFLDAITAAKTQRPLHVARIHLSGVRRLDNLHLEMQASSGNPQRCTVFIGRNGTCKTTLLRALALGLCDDSDTTSLLAEPIGRLLADGAERGGIHVELRRPGGGALTIDKVIRDAGGKDAIDTTDEPDSFPFVCAYGAGRFGTGDDPAAVYRTRDSVGTLFDYRRSLHGVELTLRRIRDFLGTERYDATIAGLKSVLGLCDQDVIDVAPGGGVVLGGPTVGDISVPLEAWADGYRMTFTWLLDFYAWAFKANRIAADGHVDGILLVDEPEQHLHPSMQAAILPRLKAVLPRVQLFVTTHSPLVALGAEPGEVVLLREQGSQVVAEPANFDFSGYSAEDMLVDARLFDTIPYAPPTARKLERYRELTARQPDERTPAESEELRGLARELRSQQLPEVRGGEAERELRALLDKHGL